MSEMKIGQLAKASGVKTDTVRKNKAPVFKVTKNTKPQPLRPKSHALLPKERQACDMATD